MAIKIKVKPSNGLDIPGVGHLPCGEHEVDLDAKDLKGAEGVSIVKPARPAQGKPAAKQS